jgi:AraC family transcriptional regulator
MRPATTSAVNTATPWRHLGGWRLREVWYAPGISQPRHRHGEPSLSLVLCGELEETSNAGSYRAAAGSLVIKPAEHWHANEYGPRGAHLVQLEAPAELQSRLPHDYGWHDTSPLARRVMAMLHHQPGSGEAAELALWDALDRVRGDDRDAHRTPSWWPRALELLEVDVVRSISASEVARTVGVHPVHLARVCRRQLGCTLHEHLRRRRVLAAWRACERGDESLAAIAARVGFADQSHMTRAFASVLGISPARLKRFATRVSSEK